jgi:hypothetical protein
MSDLIEREEAEAILWGLHWDTGESITVELKKLAALPASTRYAELERAARAVVAANDAFSAAWDTPPYTVEGERNQARSAAFRDASVMMSDADDALCAALANLDKEQVDG